MRVVVTGAGGFIGHHLVAALAADLSLDVVALARASAMPLPSGARSIEVDLATPGWTAQLPAEADVVVHLAQSRSHRAFPSGAPDVFRVNVEATFELLEWARVSKVGAFIHASTGSVYRPASRRLSEDDQVVAGSFYAASKLAGEALCTPYARQFSVTMLRFFGVYGPGASDSVLPRLMDRVERGDTIELDGGLGLLTTPTYVTDCVDAIVRSTRSRDKDVARVLNICGNEETSLRDACVLFGELLNREPHLVANDKAPIQLSGDNARAASQIGWRPQWTLADGLAELSRSVRHKR